MKYLILISIMICGNALALDREVGPATEHFEKSDIKSEIKEVIRELDTARVMAGGGSEGGGGR